MPKKGFIGVDGKARKSKKIYLGVDDKARKVKKIYIGDANNKARLAWTSELYRYIVTRNRSTSENAMAQSLEVKNPTSFTTLTSPNASRSVHVLFDSKNRRFVAVEGEGDAYDQNPAKVYTMPEDGSVWTYIGTITRRGATPPTLDSDGTLMWASRITGGSASYDLYVYTAQISAGKVTQTKRAKLTSYANLYGFSKIEKVGSYYMTVGRAYDSGVCAIYYSTSITAEAWNVNNFSSGSYETSSSSYLGRYYGCPVMYYNGKYYFARKSRKETGSSTIISWSDIFYFYAGTDITSLGKKLEYIGNLSSQPSNPDAMVKGKTYWYVNDNNKASDAYVLNSVGVWVMDAENVDGSKSITDNIHKVSSFNPGTESIDVVEYDGSRFHLATRTRYFYSDDGINYTAVALPGGSTLNAGGIAVSLPE